MTASREAARAMVPVRVAENLKLRAEAQLAAAETALGSAISAKARERAEDAKAKAVARIAELQRNGPPPRPSCSRSSMPSRLRVKPPSPPRPRGLRQPRRR